MRRIPLDVVVCLLATVFGPWPEAATGTRKSGTATGVRRVSDPLEAVRIDNSPVIDGNLDDPAWSAARVPAGTFKTYNPTYGDDLPQATDVFFAYDAKNFYAAFHCHDTEPGKIKATLCKRDAMFSDDWVGFSLDLFGNRQSSCEFFVNPLGIQGDIYNTVSSGEDSSPDWVWDSAGKMTADGYTVEVRIPLRSLRFKSGEDVRLNVLFWRRISRLGLSGSWPEMKPGTGMLNAHSEIRFESLASPRRLEVMPSFTWTWDRERMTPDRWETTVNKKDVGVGVKYGLTSSITLDATYNPDFSQVESDAVQVEVNQRYPLFYSEKRPFFMESMGIFSLAAVGEDGNFKLPVHTRRIVDPLWGAKLTGDAGRFSFGVLTAADEWPGREFDGEDNPDAGEKAYFGIARGTCSLGGENYVGGIFSGRQFAGGFNRVVGGDFFFRFGAHHALSGNVLQSYSRDEGTGTRSAGGNHAVCYTYTSRAFQVWSEMEHIDPGFRMDTAFYNRTGIDQFTVYLGPQFYPKWKKAPWLQRVNPFFFGYVIHDVVTGQDDYAAMVALRVYFAGQGQFRIDGFRAQEVWAGRLFQETGGRLSLSGWFTKWLRLGGSLRLYDNIWYDEENPFLGRCFDYGFDFTLQPNENLNLEMDFYRTRFQRPETGETVYDVKVANGRLTYQFTKAFFLRATLRYDSYGQRLLTDILASYTYIPGTVVFLGYGELFERVSWNGDQWNSRDNFQETRRGLFFKVSYNWRP